MIFLLSIVLPAAALAAEAPEADAAILAAAVRVRGYACEHPTGVERDADASRPDRPAFVVRCERGRFLVIYEGDTGPRVTPLD